MSNEDNCDNCGKDLGGWVTAGIPGISQYCSDECAVNGE